MHAKKILEGFIVKAQMICYFLSSGNRRVDYVVLRKSAKPYMLAPLKIKIKSITPSKPQILVLDGRDAKKISGKKVCLVDDVIFSFYDVSYFQ